MKTICTALLVVLVLPLFSAEYQIHDSINHPTDLYEVSGELVIGVPNFNMKRYDEFLEKINAIPGIRKVDYCSAMEVFLINYDPASFASSEEAFKTIEEALKGFRLFHKLGATHTELKAAC